MLPHGPLSIVSPTASSTYSTKSSSSFTPQPIDLDDGPSASSPHPILKEEPYHSEHVNEDMSDFDDSEPEDDLSPILNALIVSGIKRLHLFPSPI